jgi:hypothetical protein
MAIAANASCRSISHVHGVNKLVGTRRQDTDHVLHLVGDVNGQVRCGAAGAPSDVAEQRAQTGHSVLPVKQVFNTLQPSARWIHEQDAVPRTSVLLQDVMTRNQARHTPHPCAAGRTQTRRTACQRQQLLASCRRLSWLRPLASVTFDQPAMALTASNRRSLVHKPTISAA